MPSAGRTSEAGSSERVISGLGAVCYCNVVNKYCSTRIVSFWGVPGNE